MFHNLHHLLLRKRGHVAYEPYPHPVKWKANLDKAIIWVSIIGPFSAVPQVIEIWIGKEASGVSISSWSLYIVLSIIWLFYGLVHREKPIIINSVLWILLEALIVGGAIIYN